MSLFSIANFNVSSYLLIVKQNNLMLCNGQKNWYDHSFYARRNALQYSVYFEKHNWGLGIWTTSCYLLYLNRAAIEYEKRTRAGNLEQSEAMEKGMVAMSQEIEKLQAELANAEKRARAAAAVTSPCKPAFHLFIIAIWTHASSSSCHLLSLHCNFIQFLVMLQLMAIPTWDTAGAHILPTLMACIRYFLYVCISSMAQQFIAG